MRVELIFIEGLPVPKKQVEKEIITKQQKRHVKHWDVSRFMAPAPEMKYLVKGVFPYAKPCLFAAAGGAGKSYEMLKAGLYIAAGQQEPPNKVLGCEIHEFGTVVMYTAEDDLDEVHRRLEAIDPDYKLRNQAVGRFKIVPLPDAGGVFSLIRKDGQGGYETNENFDDLLTELREIDNLKAVIFDPMQPFANSDIQSDNSAGQAISNAASQMAAELNASVIFTHHVKKTNEQIITLADARNSIRGVTALVDGVRAVYVLWEVSASEAQRICDGLNVPYFEGMVFKGGVVKANGKKDSTIRFYVRDMTTGMLEDRTLEVERLEASYNPKLANALINDIDRAFANGKAYTKTGKAGLWERQNKLSHKDLKTMGKHSLADLAQILIDEDRLKQEKETGVLSAV